MNIQFDMDLFRGLNDAQKEAVTCTEGPVLVLAGAGSGKTRVLTHRIAYIVQQKLARPWQVLAVTFTNRAAGELKQRVARIVSGGDEVAAGTFHGTLLRVLKREAEILGYPKDFSVFDPDDTVRLVKQIMKDHDDERFRPRIVHSIISRLKNDLVEPDDYSPQAKLPLEQVVAGVYPEYQKRLKLLGAMDFDDLIILPIRLFRQYPAVLNNWNSRWRYLHVDEMQDTNRAQFELLRLLSGPKPNLFAVGDDDQSIYGWRGARVDNIFQFRDTFPGTKVFRLEQNYRSTQHILDLANAVVAKSVHREEKRLWTARSGGIIPVVVAVRDDLDEAREMVERIGRGVMSGKRAFRDYAVLYRTHAQSRLFEDALRSQRYPYQVLGNVGFYSRREVRDALAYFRLCLNPRDDLSLLRIIAEPPRGIGTTTLAKLQQFAGEHELALFTVMEKSDEVEGLGTRAVNACRSFTEQVTAWRTALQQTFKRETEVDVIGRDTKIIKTSETDATEKAGSSVNRLPLEAWAKRVLDESGYLGRLRDEGDFEAQGRLDNLDSLLNSLAEHSTAGGSLNEYLEQAALASDQDKYDPAADSVRLMTIHAAKGLEFPCVFVTGLEDRTFPLRSPDEPDSRDLDEERRLFYVAVTRAHDELVLTYAGMRRVWGQLIEMESSPFLEDLPPEAVEWSGLPPKSAGMAGLEAARKYSAGSAPPANRARVGRGVPYAPVSHRDRVPGPRDAAGNFRGKPDSQHEDAPALRTGDLVQHDAFGRGIVLSVTPYQDSLRVLVEFESGELKKLIQKYARLQPVKDFG